MTAPKTKAPLPETGGVLTREFLQSQLANVQSQKKNALNVYHQAVGAEAVLTDLLERLETGNIEAVEDARA